MADGPTLNPAQLRTLDLLRRSADPLVFDPELVVELRETMLEALAHFADRLDGDTLFVTKHTLASVHGCEANFMVPDDFAWSPAAARGQVAHKAIQLMLNWRGEPTPRALVDDALARLADGDDHFGRWIAGLSPGDEAELRGFAVERVTNFSEAFPPLDWRSNPKTEAAAQFPVDGPILLRARVDLTLGKIEGQESRRVIVDLKTGRVTPRHREDLRFYALVESLVWHVPPRKLATFYLDSAEPMVEEVTEGVLRAAVQRTLDGIHRIVQLRREGHQPGRRAGPTCRWCQLASDCAEGRQYLDGGDVDEVE